MKNSAQKIIAIIALAVSLGLASCEKDGLLTPDNLLAKSGQAVNSVPTPIIPTPSKKYTLVKHGTNNLTYSDDGRLIAVTSDARSYSASHTDYTYSPGKIKAVSYLKNVVVRDETFTLDASGRCTESVLTGAFGDIHWAFTYNAKGQLIYCTNKASTTGATSYTYNADGDLMLAEKSISPSDYRETTFAYDKPSGTPMLIDKYPLNVVGASEHDAYLRIFGTPSKHLVKQASYEPSGDVNFPATADQLYTYMLDANGYVTERKSYNVIGGALTDTKLYGYQVGPFTY